MEKKIFHGPAQANLFAPFHLLPVGRALHLSDAIQVSLPDNTLQTILQRRKGDTLCFFLDGAEVSVRSKITVAWKQCATKKGDALSCTVLAVHLLGSGHGADDWFRLARWLGQETTVGLEPILKTQLQLHTMLEWLPDGYNTKWVLDFGVIGTILGHVSCTHELACPYCRCAKEQWRLPGTHCSSGPVLYELDEFPNRLVAVRDVFDVIYDPMHLCNQVYTQISSALFFLAERHCCVEAFEAYFAERRAPYRRPEGRKVGRREPAYLWRQVVPHVKSSDFWTGLAHTIVCLEVSGQRDDGSTTTYPDAVCMFLNLTYKMCNACYTKESMVSSMEYHEMGDTWRQLWFLLELPAGRMTTPLHIFACHVERWVHLSGVSICNQGGERLHQGIKSLFEAHPYLARKNVPAAIVEDIDHAARQLSLL